MCVDTPSHPFGSRTRVGKVCGKSIFNFLRSLQVVFHSSCVIFFQDIFVDFTECVSVCVCHMYADSLEPELLVALTHLRWVLKTKAGSLQKYWNQQAISPAIAIAFLHPQQQPTAFPTLALTVGSLIGAFQWA